MSLRARIALGTLCMFNGVVLTALGVMALRYVDGRAGPVGAVLFWVGAACLFSMARRLRKTTDW